MICLTHRTDYIPDAINRHFVISFFFFIFFWWEGGGHHVYKVEFVSLKICTVWLHKSSLMSRSLRGSLKTKLPEAAIRVVCFLTILAPTLTHSNLNPRKSNDFC